MSEISLKLKGNKLHCLGKNTNSDLITFFLLIVNNSACFSILNFTQNFGKN